MSNPSEIEPPLDARPSIPVLIATRTRWPSTTLEPMRERLLFSDETTIST